MDLVFFKILAPESFCKECLDSLTLSILQLTLDTEWLLLFGSQSRWLHQGTLTYYLWLVFPSYTVGLPDKTTAFWTASCHRSNLSREWIGFAFSLIWLWTQAAADIKPLRDQWQDNKIIRLWKEGEGGGGGGESWHGPAAVPLKQRDTILWQWFWWMFAFTWEKKSKYWEVI